MKEEHLSLDIYAEMNNFRVLPNTNTYSNHHEYERGRYEELRNNYILSTKLPAYHNHIKQSEVSANIHCKEEDSYSHKSWQDNRVTDRKK